MTRVSREWLALRERADAAARADEFVERLPNDGPHVIHDLGAGTGSMGRWLAPRLAGSQHWVLHDRDADLLEAAHLPVPFETRQSDVTRLRETDLAGATLVTASALLDMLTETELVRLAGLCVGTGCPALLTLTVAGHVELTPADALDGRVEAAFNEHQRRSALGPDAVAAAVVELERLGAEVLVRPSPWRLGPSETSLVSAWLTGWVAAACEQGPELDAYARCRLAQADAGELAVTVGHADLLVLHSSRNRGDSA